jgi:hypothetical protein
MNDFTKSDNVDTNIADADTNIADADTNVDTNIADADTNVDTNLADADTNVDTNIADADTNVDTNLADADTNVDTNLADADTNVDTEKLFAPWDCTKWLVVSSCFFMIPAVYAYQHELYWYAMLFMCISVASANHWRRATYSLRRNIDLFFARTSFVVFFFTGLHTLKNKTRLIIGFSGVVLILCCFYMSNKLYQANNPNWYKFHFMFHFFVMCEQMLVLYNMTQVVSQCDP